MTEPTEMKPDNNTTPVDGGNGSDAWESERNAYHAKIAHLEEQIRLRDVHSATALNLENAVLTIVHREMNAANFITEDQALDIATEVMEDHEGIDSCDVESLIGDYISYNCEFVDSCDVENMIESAGIDTENLESRLDEIESRLSDVAAILG